MRIAGGTTTVAAVDLGATSGRVMVGRVSATSLSLQQAVRFPNTPVRLGGGLHWKIGNLYSSVLEGLRAALHEAPGLASIGVDSWAVDYGLFRRGRLLGIPHHYRDERTGSGVAAVHGVVPFEQLYGRNGLQFLPFNTVYQLAAERDAGLLDCADSLLLIPDLLNYWLTGEMRAERTNASTTGLLDVVTGQWDTDLLARLSLPAGLLPKLIEPGTAVGPLTAELGLASGAPVQVTAVGSHDTASAVAAVPMNPDDGAYISCGTWGLVGVELAAPVLTGAAREANFTNEGGVDGRTRFLHNVMGLWLLSESVRAWERDGETIDLPALLVAAAEVSTRVPIFDTNDPVFLPTGDMPARIGQWLRERDLVPPASRAGFVRCILESLAEAFAAAVCTAGELTGKQLRTIHLVGGGSQNELLCRLTAGKSGLPVVAGPVEATALGNVLIQARAQGVFGGDAELETLRTLVGKTFSGRRYEPQSAPGC